MKKTIPLTVLESLEKFANLNEEKFKVIESSDFILRTTDCDEKSEFYFDIKDFRPSNGTQFLIDRKPYNKYTIENEERWIKAEHLQKYFGEWLEILESYETVKTFFDDPIINAFAEEYYYSFEVMDDEANKPLKPNQILLLDEHLEYIQDNIEKHQTESNKRQIAEIKNNIIELRESLTSNSKEKVIRNLSKIWAKLTKLGTKFMKEFLNNTRKEAIKQGVKLAITEVVKHIDFS